jgi:putative flippase GtrA
VPLQLVVFAGVGGVFNILYGGLYLALREAMNAQWANALALVLSTIAGTWGHRRVTFGVRGQARTVPHQTLGLLLLAFGLAVTAGALWALEASVDEPSRLSELVVLAAANVGVGLVRFGTFRVAMVPERPDRTKPSRPPSVARPKGKGWSSQDGRRGDAMQARVGDRLHVHGRVVGAPDPSSEIIEVRGEDGAPPYVVRHQDGHETLVFPGPDASIEPPTSPRES